MTTLDRRQFLLGTASGLALSSMSAFAAAPEKKPLIFKLGMVTYNVAKDWDLPTILKVCKEVGIAAVECRTTHKHGVEPVLSPDERKEVKKQFADSGVVFWGCGSVCEFHSPDPAVVKKNIADCKSFVDLVKDLGGKGVKVRPNNLPKEVPVEKTLEQIGKALTQCGNFAKDAGIEICVEVHGPGTQIPENIKTIMTYCDHKSVGLTWNSNPTDVKDGSVAESFKLLSPWIRSCHINELEKDASGMYPYRELFRLLRESGYDRYTMIEVGKAPKDVESGIAFLKDYKALWTKLVADGSADQ
jgi:sugar phosphate isomerase/epimerase